MRILLFISFLTAAWSVSAQQEEKSVRAVIDKLFTAMQSGDSAKAATLFHPSARLQSTFTDRSGKTVLRSDEVRGFLDQIGGKPAGTTYEEKLLSAEVRIDENMATVWAPYEFYLNGQLSHCGVNAFQLIRLENSWSIIQITDTRRKSCK